MNLGEAAPPAPARPPVESWGGDGAGQSREREGRGRASGGAREESAGANYSKKWSGAVTPHGPRAQARVEETFSDGLSLGSLI
jgi:hypothetical protein